LWIESIWYYHFHHISLTHAYPALSRTVEVDPMAKQNLTKSVVENLAPSDQDWVIWDTALPGFGIRVKPSNVKSYIVQYRNRKSGVSRRKTIGQHGPLLTFHKAKERARIILADALKGNDPVADDRAVRDAPNDAGTCSRLPRTTCGSEEAAQKRQE